MRTRFFVIHNPNAGRLVRRLYDEILGCLQTAGCSLEVITTARRGEGMKAAAEAARSGRFDAVVAAGGDGTLHDVAEGLVGSSTPLGVIPMGTGNVFARELNLSRSAAELAKILLAGQAREIPVAVANGRPFLSIVGVGFDAAAVRAFEDQGARKLGQAGFVLPALRALRSYRDRPLRVTSPHGEADASWVIVTRVKRYAGDLMLAPDADLQQAQFHVLSMTGQGPLNRVRQLSALVLGHLRHDPCVRVECADWLRIDGDKSVPVQIDGEVFGNLPLKLGISPQKLWVLVSDKHVVPRRNAGIGRLKPQLGSGPESGFTLG